MLHYYGMNLLGSLQNVLDIQWGLCPLAPQNSQSFVGSLKHVLYWMLVVCMTSESPTEYMHRIIFNYIQGDPDKYFWTSFWVYLPLLWSSILQFNSRSSPPDVYLFLQLIETLLELPSLFTFQRMTPGWKLNWLQGSLHLFIFSHTVQFYVAQCPQTDESQVFLSFSSCW